MLRRERHHIHRQKFSRDEDLQIINAVGICGEHNWPRVIQMARLNRTPRDVRERWKNYLDPKVETAWTEDDDHILQTLAEDHLGKWAYLASQIPGKSAIQVRTRYCQLNPQRMNGAPPVEKGCFPGHENPPFPVQFDDGTTWEDTSPWDENPSPP
jgi:hypothetical protein